MTSAPNSPTSQSASSTTRDEALASFHPSLQPRLESFLRREAAWGERFILDSPGRPERLIRLDSNDYLNLTGHPRVVRAQLAALEASEFVVQSGVFLGDGHPVRRFERDLASYVGKDDVHLCGSGYAANLALLQCIAGAEVPVYVDSLAHMSLWEGIRAAGARPTAFRHNDVNHLRRLIARGGPGVVVVDSVYSGTGSVCPLREVVQACEDSACTLVVDESHSLGLYGPQGGGLCAELGLTHRVHHITASLAKAFAGRAGMYTAPACLRPYFMVTAYPTIFSSCLLPVEVAGLAETLQVLRESDGARERLQQAARAIRTGFAQAGFPVEENSAHIICLEAGLEQRTMQLRDELDARGVIGAIFAAPATATARSMLRLTVHAGLQERDLADIARAAQEVAELVQPWSWRSARRQAFEPQV